MAENMKEKIIKASLELFNENGSHKITTNHIIDKLDISPGTFYYHFRNKEEIIREIFSLITYDFEKIIDAGNSASGIGENIDILKNMFSIYNKYLFFYSEISSLLDRDEILKKMYLENYSMKYTMLSGLLSGLERDGILKKGFSASPEVPSIINSLWILSDYWVPFLKTTGRLDDGAVVSGYRNYLLLLMPHMRKNAAAAAEKYL